MSLRRLTVAAATAVLLTACFHGPPRDATLGDALSDAAAEAGDGGTVILADHTEVDAVEVVVVPAGTDAEVTADALGLRPPRQAVAPVAEGAAALVAFRTADDGLVWSTIDTGELEIQLDGTYAADQAVLVTEEADRFVLTEDD